MTGKDGIKIDQWMDELKTKGKFTVDAETKENMDQFIVGGFATEAETMATIKQCYEETHYVLDTHTAVALKVYQDYQKASESTNKTVIDSTAHPCKFIADVHAALNNGEKSADELFLLEGFESMTEMEVHRGLLNLDQKEILHQRLSSKEDMLAQVKAILRI